MELKGIPNFSYIEKFKLNKACGEHSRLYTLLSIDNGTQGSFLGSLGKQICVMDEGKPVFFGVIHEARVEYSISGTMIELRAVSSTILEDEEKKWRIFQAEDNKYGDILSNAKLEMKNVKLKLDGKLSAKAYKHIAIQEQETNFVFINRIANYAEYNVWVRDTLEGNPIIEITNKSDRKATIKLEEIISYWISRSSLSGSNAYDSATLVTQKFIDLGFSVTIEGEQKQYIVMAVDMEQKHNAIVYTYQLQEARKAKNDNEKIKHLEKTVRLKAKVKNVDDPEKKGRLQVEFIDEGLQDINKDKPRWMPFLTSYTGKSSGIVFIPDKDDIVDVVFSNQECYITAARRENKLLDECNKPIEKYIGNNTKQRIFWKEKSLELMSDENKIYMDKDKIELTVAKSKVIIDKDSIVLQAGKAVVKLDNNGIIMDGANSKMQLEGKGINAKAKNISLDGSGQVNISGGKINLA